VPGNESFQIHLRSLTDFAQELTTQLAGMAQAAGQLETLAGGDLPLGQFGEAVMLSRAHHDAVADMATIVDQALQAIDFAEDVTLTVASSYEVADRQVASSLTNLTGGIV
jgi:hypothetical protein